MRKDRLWPKTSYQTRRRERALSEQHNKRNELLESIRRRRGGEDGSVVEEWSGGPERMEEGAGIEGCRSGSSLDQVHQNPHEDRTRSLGSRSVRGLWASQLMAPEWLVEIPVDLADSWYVMSRPEGQRCLVVASHGATMVRSRTGHLKETFPSGLPSGGGAGDGRAMRECILDCIFHPGNNTFYVLGHDLCNCTTEFRMFWKQSKLDEDIVRHDSDVYSFEPLPVHAASPEGLLDVYTAQVAFEKDGLYFLHKSACYHGGQTPLALVWKDASTSKYFIDTDASSMPLDRQQIVLSYSGNPVTRALLTGDESSLAVATLPDSFLKAMGDQKLYPGRLLRFTLDPDGVRDVGGHIWLQLAYLGTANQRRSHADTISKILFQNMARREPITIQDLVDASSSASGRSKMASGTSACLDGDDLGSRSIMRT
eukprot:jgi/Picsp_1/3739/NSC_06575-R1_mrna cap enzyme